MPSAAACGSPTRGPCSFSSHHDGGGLHSAAFFREVPRFTAPEELHRLVDRLEHVPVVIHLHVFDEFLGSRRQMGGAASAPCCLIRRVMVIKTPIKLAPVSLNPPRSKMNVLKPSSSRSPTSRLASTYLGSFISLAKLLRMTMSPSTRKLSGMGFSDAHSQTPSIKGLMMRADRERCRSRKTSAVSVSEGSTRARCPGRDQVVRAADQDHFGPFKIQELRRNDRQPAAVLESGFQLRGKTRLAVILEPHPRRRGCLGVLDRHDKPVLGLDVERFLHFTGIRRRARARRPDACDYRAERGHIRLRRRDEGFLRSTGASQSIRSPLP